MTTPRERIQQLIAKSAEIRRLEREQDELLQQIGVQLDSIAQGLEEVEALLEE